MSGITDTTIIDTIEIPEIWGGGWFRDRATWASWFALLKVLFNLPLSGAEFELYRRCTGREQLPGEPVREAWLVCGRRGGKSFVLALIACYLAIFKDWRPYLSPGEVGTIKVLAVDRRQARVIHRYCRALLLRVPALEPFVRRVDDETIELNNNITLEIQTASFRTVRGYTIITALCDEIAFWRSDESANPDTEILDALRPAMATVPGSMLLCASSPYARRGALYQAYRRYWGQPGKTLVWRADTRTMNPTVPDEVIVEAYERDPASAAAEYGAEFRTDVETFVAREVVEALVVPGRYELPPTPGTIYHAFADPSGGSSDSMTLAIGHYEGRGYEHGVLDLLREVRPPFSPESVVAEFAETLRQYRIFTVTGDRYGGEWPAERFRGHGIRYDVADKTKSDLYRDFLPVLNSRQVELLDHPRLITQLCALERRTARGGRDTIDHPPGGHDDIANVAAGVLAVRGPQPMIVTDEMLAGIPRPHRRW